MFTACSNGDNSSNSESSASQVQSNVSAKDFVDTALEKVADSNLTASTAMGDTSDKGFNSYCEKLYYVELDKLSDGYITYADQGGLADEISVLKPADNQSIDDLIDALGDRVQRRISEFEGYKPEEVDKVRSAEIFTADGFAILVIADNATQIKEAFEQ